MPLDPTVQVEIIAGAVAIVGIIGAKTGGTKKEERKERRTLEAECRSQADYINVLRGTLNKAGVTPPPYPAELRDVDSE